MSRDESKRLQAYKRRASRDNADLVGSIADYLFWTGYKHYTLAKSQSRLKSKKYKVVRQPQQRSYAADSALEREMQIPICENYNTCGGNKMDSLDRKIIDSFSGKIVRKDLTALMKRAANVPTFVLEYLLGMYCSTDDEETMAMGLDKIRKILAENYVRSDESELIKNKMRELGSYTIIDRITAHLDVELDKYVGTFKSFSIGEFIIPDDYVMEYSKILTGGIWCISKIEYLRKNEFDEEEDDEDGRKKKKKKRTAEDSPFKIISLKPIQMPNLDMEEFIENRKNFTFEEWRDLLLRSSGYEPDALSEKEKMHFIERMVPLCERNYNYVELGPRGTGKSHIYKENSPYAILMSGGQTTTANLFGRLSNKAAGGLVTDWDCVAFDEVAGIKTGDQGAIQILKDYMASGSYARGRDEVRADASLVYVGNINDSVENLLKTTHLFSPFPMEFNNDSAFFDRIHYYVPGWETPKMRSDLLTEKYGLITDCLAEFCREMRKQDFTHEFDRFFRLNKDFNKRDEIAVRKTFAGLAKLLFPDRIITEDEARIILDYAIEGRRRVKEQLKIMAGVEFSDVKLGYYDENGNEVIISVPEQSSKSLVPEKTLPAGHVFAVGRAIEKIVGGVKQVGETCIYRLENKRVNGSGKIIIQGVEGQGRDKIKAGITAAFQYFQSYSSKIVAGKRYDESDYLLFYDDIQGKGRSTEVSLAEFIGLCSAISNRPVMGSLVVAGDIKLSGSLAEITNLEDIIRVAKNAGAKRVLLPMDCLGNLQNVSRELLQFVQPIFYNDPVDAAKKALDIY